MCRAKNWSSCCADHSATVRAAERRLLSSADRAVLQPIASGTVPTTVSMTSMSERSDTHWSCDVGSKTKDLSKEALGEYKTAKLYVRRIFY